jgi:formate dehydrogenase major subunit
MTNSFPELESSDCIFIIGSNTTVAHPLVATRIYRAKAKGAKLIVADPRRIQMARFADVYARQTLGTDVALLNGMMHVIYKNGWHNEEFIKERTEGFDTIIEVIEKFPPERAAEITGVDADSIVKMAEYYAKAKAGSIVYCMGITQHTTGVDNVRSLANLAMMCGHIGRLSTGVNPLRGQNNVQGACDMGGLPNVYPGYQVVTVPENQQKFEKAWNAELSPNPGLTVTEMMPAIEEGKMKGLVILGENPMVSDPDINHVKHALEAAEFLMVVDIFPTQTAELADLVLPGACFAEKDGTFSNSERRVQMVRKAVEPPGDARTDWTIFQEISNRMGYPMNYEKPEDIFTEITQLTPSYGGMNYSRLQGDGLCWPCPTTDHPGTVFLHEGRFARGLGLFQAIDYRPPAETPDEEYPFWLTTGRTHMHYHTGTMTRRSSHLHNEMPEAIMEMNPEDATHLEIQEGEMVRITSRRGAIETRVQLTDKVDRGLVFMPFHFAESAANVLTNTAYDPIAKIPELKVCAVRLEKAA